MGAALLLLRKEPIGKRVPQGPCGSGREIQSSLGWMQPWLIQGWKVAWGAASWSQQAGRCWWKPWASCPQGLARLAGCCKEAALWGAGGTLKPPAGDANRTCWEATLWGTEGPPWETAWSEGGWVGECAADSLGSLLLELLRLLWDLLGSQQGCWWNWLDAECGRGAIGNPNCCWSPGAAGTAGENPLVSEEMLLPQVTSLISSDKVHKASAAKEDVYRAQLQFPGRAEEDGLGEQ